MRNLMILAAVLVGLGTYMGFAFLPVSIGTFVAGATSGPLVAHYVGSRDAAGVFSPGPAFDRAPQMWYWVGAIGVASTLAMIAYDRLVVRRAAG